MEPVLHPPRCSPLTHCPRAHLRSPLTHCPRAHLLSPLTLCPRAHLRSPCLQPSLSLSPRILILHPLLLLSSPILLPSPILFISPPPLSSSVSVYRTPSYVAFPPAWPSASTVFVLHSPWWSQHLPFLSFHALSRRHACSRATNLMHVQGIAR